METNHESLARNPETGSAIAPTPTPTPAPAPAPAAAAAAITAIALAATAARVSPSNEATDAAERAGQAEELAPGGVMESLTNAATMATTVLMALPSRVLEATERGRVLLVNASEFISRIGDTLIIVGESARNIEAAARGEAARAPAAGGAGARDAGRLPGATPTVAAVAAAAAPVAVAAASVDRAATNSTITAEQLLRTRSPDALRR